MSSSKFRFQYKLTIAGQSLMELVVGISLITVVVGAVAVITTYGLRNSQFSKNQAQATKLAQQNLELVRTIKSSNYGVCTLDQPPTACSSWEDIWPPNAGVGSYTILKGCTVNQVPKDYCLQYKTPTAVWNLDTPGFTGEIIIADEATVNQKRVTSRVYWTDTTGVHSSDLVTVLSQI